MVEYSFETSYRGFEVPSDRLHTPGLLEGFALGVDAVLGVDQDADDGSGFWYWTDNDTRGNRFFYRISKANPGAPAERFYEANPGWVDDPFGNTHRSLNAKELYIDRIPASLVPVDIRLAGRRHDA